MNNSFYSNIILVEPIADHTLWVSVIQEEYRDIAGAMRKMSWIRNRISPEVDKTIKKWCSEQELNVRCSFNIWHFESEEDKTLFTLRWNNCDIKSLSE